MELDNSIPVDYFGELLSQDWPEQKFALDLAAIVAVTDSNGVIKYVNEKFCRLSGYSRDELIGKTHHIVNSRFHAPDFFKNLWDTINSGKIWKGEIRNKNKSGNYYWEDTTIVPFIGSNGKPVQFLSIRHEITALKEAQKTIHEQKARLAVASKFSALGEMAANLSHEINNPLGVILGRCEMLLGQIQSGQFDIEQMAKMIEHIDFTARRIEKIIKSMRSFSVATEGDPFLEVPLSKIVHETVDFVQQRFRDYSIELNLSTIDPCLTVECRSTEISQIILNLLNNAFDAVQKLETKWVKLEIQETLDFVEIAVTDSGFGIAEHLQERLFDPFFSTKEKKYGTGLGLSISKGFAEKHNALLEYIPASRNTRFQLRLLKKQSCL
jgi:PAS domain S-box-containing protein